MELAASTGALAIAVTSVAFGQPSAKASDSRSLVQAITKLESQWADAQRGQTAGSTFQNNWNTNYANETDWQS
jgi:hypothetical protein